MRTITGTEAMTVAPARTSIATSPLFELACPNLPEAKKGTVPPLVGTVTVMVSKNTPVAPARNTTRPPPDAVFPVIWRSTEGPAVPDGFVKRILQGEGPQPRKRASWLVLLFICSSIIIHSLLLHPACPFTSITG